jgi:hypothetical protein
VYLSLVNWMCSLQTSERSQVRIPLFKVFFASPFVQLAVHLAHVTELEGLKRTKFRDQELVHNKTIYDEFLTRWIHRF